ncbi:MAG: hypothetical protein RLZZ296_113, partial [Pseudomonadota bacterium]
RFFSNNFFGWCFFRCYFFDRYFFRWRFFRHDFFSRCFFRRYFFSWRFFRHDFFSRCFFRCYFFSGGFLGRCFFSDRCFFWCSFFRCYFFRSCHSFLLDHVAKSTSRLEYVKRFTALGQPENRGPAPRTREQKPRLAPQRADGFLCSSKIMLLTGSIPRQCATRLVFNHSGFKEVALFLQVDHLAHPWERIFFVREQRL